MAGIPSEQLNSKPEPEDIYSGRLRTLKKAESYKAPYLKSKKRERLWREGQKFLAIAPVLFAAAAWEAKIEDMDSYSKAGLIGFSAVGAFVLASYAEFREDEQLTQSYNVASSAALAYDGLNMVRPPWINEGLEAVTNRSRPIGST